MCKILSVWVTPDRACYQRSPLGAHARACPTGRPCPPVVFFFPVFSFEPLTYDTRPLAFRIPRLSAWRFPNSPKGNITATHPPSVLVKNARAAALIRAHCAISFALCGNELFLHSDLRCDTTAHRKQKGAELGELCRFPWSVFGIAANIAKLPQLLRKLMNYAF